MRSVKTLSLLLAFALIVASSPARAQDLPPVETEPADSAATNTYVITPEQYEQIQPALEAQEAAGAVVVTQPHSNANPAASIPAPPPPPAPPLPPPPGDMVCVGCDGFTQLVADLGSSSWSGDDGAIVILVVVGAVVVLSVVVYAGAYVYQALTGYGDVDYWWDLEGHASILFGNHSDGTMAGVRLNSGLAGSDARVGLVLDAGVLQNEITPPRGLVPVDIDGAYAMAGAGIRWNLGGYKENPTYLGAELLAGATTDEAVDLISSARFVISMGMNKHLRLGFSLGALYTSLEADQGLLNDIDEFSTQTGLHVGVRF